MKNLLLLLVLFSSLNIYAQTKKVLFIGNSYTGVNNLPQLVYNVAVSVGDTLIYDQHTPGGARLMQHATNATALAKISSDDWDHVVLQAQSQEPSFPDGQVASEVFPYAEILCDSIRANNECTRPIFFMTWGRENGDASNCAVWPPVCTYEGMDSLLNLRYRMMGNDNDADVSPVGAVWNYIRDNYPDIDLYSNDGSHPSTAGSYAAACTFYSIIFRKNPTLISFNSLLSDTDADAIKEAVRIIAFDELLEWNVGADDPGASFSYTQNDTEITFMNSSENADSFQWDFGDGDISSEENPTHIFQNNNTFTIQLIAERCGVVDTFSTEIVVEVVAIKDLLDSEISIFPNPTENLINIKGIPKESTVQIVDDLGREIQRIYTSNNTLQMNISSLAQGVYFLKIKNKRDGIVLVEKIIKN
jgi:PKD repeat protein